MAAEVKRMAERKAIIEEACAFVRREELRQDLMVARARLAVREKEVDIVEMVAEMVI